MQRRMAMESLDAPCDICGDFGYADLLVMCSSCPAWQHIYCAAHFSYEVPEEWYCEVCQPVDHVNLTVSHLQEESTAMVSSPASKDGQDNFRRQTYLKRQTTAIPSKVKCLSTEEVIKLSSGERKSSPSWNRMSLKPNATKSSTRQNSLKSKLFASKSPARAKGDHHLLSSDCRHPLKSGSLNIGSSIYQQREISAAKELKGKKDLVQQPEKHIGDQQSMDIDGIFFEREASFRAEEKFMKFVSPISPSNCSQPMDKSGDDNDAVAEYGCSLEETRFLHYILPKLEVCRPYLPALSATWSGSLKFPGDVNSDDSSYFLRAHPPCSVYRKAYELSLHMPMEIQMEPIPLSRILTDIFQNEGPDVGDIGLYFYPANTVDRYTEKYSALVEVMVSQEYAMRGHVDGAELLLFTSKELPVDSNLFIVGLHSEYFLWGIFRRVRSILDCESLHEELDAHPPLSVVDHSNDGRLSSNKRSTIDSITEIDDLSKNSSKGGSTSREEETVDEIALPRTGFTGSFQEHARDVVVDRVAANYTRLPLVETTCCPEFDVKREDRCAETVGSSSVVETPKQSNQQVRVKVQEITSDKHDVVERSPKPLPKIEKPDKKVGSPELGCSFRNWVQLNTSGTSRGNTGSAGAGGTVHTSSGKWVLGYSLRLGKWNSLAADLWAIFQGLKLVWNTGYRHVRVVSDSYTALECLKTAPQASDPNSDLIQCCRDLMLRDWDCTASHISREKNAAAAWLADHSEHYSLGLNELEEPPQELAHILKSQDNGISPPSWLSVPRLPRP